MAVASTMLALGTEAPPFALPDVRTRSIVSSDEFAQGGLLVMFICNHCPYVKRIMKGLAQFGTDYVDTDLGIVAISSNDVSSYPEDSPEELARVANAVGYPFPLLYDENQDVARAFAAACTPDFYLFDRERRLVYRGEFDGARPSNDVPVTGASLRAAVDALLAGRPVPEEQRPSLGCSIKWKTDQVVFGRG